MSRNLVLLVAVVFCFLGGKSCIAGTPDQWRQSGIPAANNAVNISPTTNGAAIDVIFGSSVAANKALVVQAKVSQAVPVIQAQTSTGAISFSVPVPVGTLTGANNNLIGIDAGDGLTSGARNFLAGNNAGGAATSGAMSDVTAIGNNAGLLNTANENVFMGSGAGDATTTATRLVFIGFNAGGASTGVNNTYLGFNSGLANTSGTNNTLCGQATGIASGTWSNCAFFGSAAGALNTAAENSFFGSLSGNLNTSGTGQAFFGYNTGVSVTGSNNSIFGHNAGSGFTSGARNCLLGKDAGSAVGTAMSDTCMFGYQSGLLNTADQNVFIGAFSGTSNVSSAGNTMTGYSSGKFVTGADNSIFGSNSGDGIGNGARNSLFGKDAGKSGGASTMTDCAMFGYQAGLLNTATGNTFFGSSSGAANTSGTGSSFFGFQSGDAVTGNNNTCVGHLAGGTTLTTGVSNILIGKSTDTTLSNSSNNFVAGSGATQILDVYFGEGMNSTAAPAYTLNGTGGSGSDNAGANLQLAGGKGTGLAAPGNVVIKYPLKTTTGTTLQSLSTQSYPISTTLFTANTGTVTVSADVVNTTETTLLGTLTAGSKSLEGGMLSAGRAIRVSAGGIITGSASPATIQFRFKIGSTSIIATGAAGPTANTSGVWKLEQEVLVRTFSSTGTTKAVGYVEYQSTSAVAFGSFGFNTAATVDMTTTANIDLTVQYGANTAGNSITCEQCVVEILY